MRTQLIADYYNGDEYLTKLRAKADVIKQCADPLYRAQYISDVWSVNPVRFIEDILVLKLVAFNNAIKPFFLFPYQEKILWKLVEAERSGEDVEILIDKLREMGMTWLISAYMYWRWLFTPNWSGFILSRTETEVDNGTDSPDDCIFGKIRFFINHTPKWLIPEGFQSKVKKGTSTDSTLRLMNPVMGTSITGSSTNTNAGRSRRYSFVFVDECFFIEKFLEVHRALMSVARVGVYVSSVKQGKTAEKFKKMCEDKGNYITLSWKDHPWKDQEWFDEKMKVAEFDPEAIKEIQVDYSVNIRDQYYPEIRQSEVLPLEYRPGSPLYCFLDFGKQDLTIIGWCQFDGNHIDILECYANRQKSAEWYVPFLNPDHNYQPNPDQYNPQQLEFLSRVRHWQKPRGYFGEHAHFVKVMPLNISIAQVLFRYGIRLMYNQNAIKYEPRRHATSSLLSKIRFNENSDGVMELYDAIANSRYIGTNSSVSSSRETAMKPRHDDEIADYRSALENLCVNIPRVLRSQREDVGESFKTDNFAANIIKYLKI